MSIVTTLANTRASRRLVPFDFNNIFGMATRYANGYTVVELGDTIARFELLPADLQQHVAQAIAQADQVSA